MARIGNFDAFLDTTETQCGHSGRGFVLASAERQGPG